MQLNNLHSKRVVSTHCGVSCFWDARSDDDLLLNSIDKLVFIDTKDGLPWLLGFQIIPERRKVGRIDDGLEIRKWSGS